MEILNWLLLSVLTGLGGWAALSLALLFEPEGRAEAALLTLLMFWGVIVAPIFALGYANLLYPTPVALFSGILSTGVLAGCARRQGARALLATLRSSGANLVKLATDAFRACWQARSFSLFGLIAAAGIIVGTLLLTYLVPADESWDGLYYHQPIVGFALQNHGFSLVDLPNTLLAQTINGYPKFGEAFSLWFVLFTDKTLIEVGGSLAAPGLLLAVFLLARRYSEDRAVCIGWAAVVLLMPGIYSQLRTTMIDVELWLFVMSAVYFSTKPKLRIQDAVASLVATAWVVGTKSTGLVLAPALIFVPCLRLFRPESTRKLAFCLLPALALVATVGGLTLVRNWRAFHNPFWPVSFSSRVLGLDFRGLATLSQVAPDPNFTGLIAQLYDHPAGGVRDIILRGYGYAVPWVVAPVGVVGLLHGMLVALKGAVQGARDWSAENLALVAAVTLAPFFASPSFSNARYNLQAVVLAVLGVVWLGGHGWQRLQEGALASSVALSLVSFVWCGYLWGLSLDWKGIYTLAAHSKAERASMNFSTFQMPASVAKRREAELGRGDVAAFTADLSFIGVLWNDTFSNRVVYLAPHGNPGLLADLDRAHARWVAVGQASPARRILDKSEQYELVGSAAQQDKTVIFRRRAVVLPPK